MNAPWVLALDAAWRLGPQPVVLALLGRGAWRRRLAKLLPGLSPDAAGPLDGADIRPLWEAHRWAELPGLPPGTLATAVEARLAAQPPYAGPLWLCGQEAAFRALHLVLAAALHGETPPRTAMAVLARRIGANPAYAMAQDNNHPVSEAAGLLVCGLALADLAMARRGARRLDRAILRLVDASGGFAQPSPAYHRLLLDTVTVTEWLTRRANGPHLAPAARQRMAAATRWLHRLICPHTGALPRIGHQDGSCLADLSDCGPDDASGSLERAARLFCGVSAGWADDPGSARLGLPVPANRLRAPARWYGGGLLGVAGGRLRGLLRTGPLRFRPNHADLLHLDVWDGPLNLLRDGGTGAYNPTERWWLTHLQGTAAHNTVEFDGEDQMPRVGPFLFARWPRMSTLPDGATLRDHRGRTHAREVTPLPDGLRVHDRIGGRFAEAVLRWRLAPGPWALTADGVALGPHRLAIAADAPMVLTLTQGWESLAYGQVTPCPVLEARVAAPAGVTTTLRHT